MAQGDRKEKGIVISPCASADPIRNIEISNMEIFHWSGVGIQVVDNVELAESGRLFNTNRACGAHSRKLLPSQPPRRRRRLRR